MTDDNQRLAHLETDVADLKVTLGRIDATVVGLNVTVVRLNDSASEIKDMLKTLYSVLIASNGRAEEQSKRIDDLSRTVAAVIPQHIATIGAAR